METSYRGGVLKGCSSTYGQHSEGKTPDGSNKKQKVFLEECQQWKEVQSKHGLDFSR